MTSLKMLKRLSLVLWRSGLLRIPPGQLVAILRAWWQCRNSFAFLGAMAAVRAGSRVAIEDDDGRLTFSGLLDQSLGLAHTLGQDGIGPGSQVALVCYNDRGFVIGLLACTRLGADVLPLGPDLPLLVMERILERQKISLLLHSRDLGCKLAALKLRTLPIEAPLTRPEAELPATSRGGELIVLTSGTTGLSKGIRRRPTLGQLLPLVAGLLESIPVTMHRPIVLAIPLHHGYGIATLAMSLALGAPLQLARRYDIAPLLDRVGASDRPFLVTVPTLLSRWLPSAATSPQPAAIVTGSAPLDAALCTRTLHVVGPVLFNLYGSSEAGLVAMASPETLRLAPGCVGHPLPGNRVRLLDLAGAEVSPEKVGRIFVRGPFVLASQPDGWRETGDLGRFDSSGHLFVCGRADSMLVSGGENVYPYEVEDVLASHPAVVEVALLVVDDSEFGQRMVAAVVLQPGAEVDAQQLSQWLKERLERYKIPRSFHLLSNIPRNPLGKVDRAALSRLLDP